MERPSGFPAPVALGWDVGRGTLVLDQLTYAVGIIGLVGEYDGAWAQVAKQSIGDLGVMCLPCSQTEPDGKPLPVDNDVNLGGESSRC